MAISLNDFVTKYNGKYVGDGQCGNLVRQYWNEVDMTVPPSYPNSRDYWFNPVPGYDKVQTPSPGAIAIYDGHAGYPEGHSAIVYDSRVFEQNANPDGSPAHLYARPTTNLLGYLHKQGGTVEPADYRANDGDVVNIYNGMLGRKPSADEIKIYTGQPFKTIIYAFMGSDEFKARVSGGGPTPTVLNKGDYRVQ